LSRKGVNKLLSRLKIASKLRQYLDKNLDILPEYLDDKDLGGACGICSMVLKALFIKSGHRAKVIHGNFNNDYPHCWVESGNFIFDITATQFHCSLANINRKVVKLKIGSSLYKKYYFPEKEYTNIRSFYSWPIEQKPTKKIMEKIMGKI